MATLYDVAHFCSWNGYAEDMRSYLGVDKAAWTNKEFWFPYGANLGYGSKKKTRIQCICERMGKGIGPVARIQQLLADGAKPDIQDADGWTALLICCRDAWKEHLEIMKLLLDAGADINQNNIYIPLEISAYNGNISIVQELIRRGADVNLCKNGSTPINSAAKNGHLDVVKLLVSAGAVINEDVFKSAIQGGDPLVLKYLLSLGSIPKDSIYIAVYHNKPKMIRMLAKAGADMNFDFPMHLAITFDHYDCLIELCRGGANIEIMKDGVSPLRDAMIIEDNKAIEILCDHKANMNTMINGMSLLHEAILLYEIYHNNNRLQCIKIILKAEPNLTLLNEWGNTAAEDAREKELPEIVTEIQRAALKQRFKKLK